MICDFRTSEAPLKLRFRVQSLLISEEEINFCRLWRTFGRGNTWGTAIQKSSTNLELHLNQSFLSNTFPRSITLVVVHFLVLNVTTSIKVGAPHWRWIDPLSSSVWLHSCILPNWTRAIAAYRPTFLIGKTLKVVLIVAPHQVTDVGRFKATK